jgi:tripartite-type tricarboxylate transporter receptor subunit TctC
MRNAVSRLSALAAVAFAVTLSTSALAQDRVVRILVGFAPGGTADVVARLIAEKMKDTLGQTVIVENRPGATGRIAAEAVKNGPPDGSLVTLATIGTMVVSPHAYKSNPFDTLKDFAPVSQVTNLHLAMAVATTVPAKNMKEYVAWAKANRDKAFYATSGAGTLPHFLGLLVAREAGVELTHVPYKGTSAYMAELTTGQVPAAFDAMGDLSEQHKAGKLRILASAGNKRSAAMPDIPTLKDEGYNVEGSAWFGVFAPAATPKPIVDRLSAAIAKAVQSPDVAARLAALNMEGVGNTPDEFARTVASDWTKWGTIVKASGFTLE